jgi:hypothetical protein
VLDRIKAHFVDYALVALLFGGMLYAATTAYKTSIKVDEVLKVSEANENRIREISKFIASEQLKNGTLTKDAIEALIGSEDLDGFELEFKALDTDRDDGR